MAEESHFNRFAMRYFAAIVISIVGVALYFHNAGTDSSRPVDDETNHQEANNKFNFKLDYFLFYCVANDLEAEQCFSAILHIADSLTKAGQFTKSAPLYSMALSAALNDIESRCKHFNAKSISEAPVPVARRLFETLVNYSLPMGFSEELLRQHRERFRGLILGLDDALARVDMGSDSLTRSLNLLKVDNPDVRKLIKLMGEYGCKDGLRIFHNEIWIGMSTEQARIVRGNPESTNRGVGQWGVHEQWVYPQYEVAEAGVLAWGHLPPKRHVQWSGKTTYLYFENDVLTSWQESE